MVLVTETMIAAAKSFFAHGPERASARRKVLMITGRADFGGGPEHVFQLARAMRDASAVHIACPREEPYWSRYQSLVGPGRMLEIPHRQVNLRSLGRLVRFICERRIEIVHGHGRAAGILARPAALLAGVRCFHTAHGGTPVTGVRTLFYAGVEYLLSAFTQGIIAVSTTEARALRWLCAAPGRLETILNGVEIPQALEGSEKRLGGRLRVVHVTRFVFQKNSELLIEIFDALRKMRQLDAFEFVVLGDGPGRSAFEAAVASRGLGDCVKVLGSVSDPGAYLGGAFCFVSTSRWEGLPLALLEAMARGVPVIATDVPGNSDAVADDQTGFLYALGSPRLAAVRLAELARDPARWKQMARAARHKAEEDFSVQKMADATLRLYARENRPGIVNLPIGSSIWPLPGVGKAMQGAPEA